MNCLNCKGEIENLRKYFWNFVACFFAIPDIVYIFLGFTDNNSTGKMMIDRKYENGGNDT
jgi:hypothetical protein